MRPIQKKFIAALLFLLAFMISLTVSSHLYFKYRLPTDTSIINKKLDTEFIQSRFDVIGARKAGATDKEIMNHLSDRFSKEYSKNITTLITVEGAIYLVCILVSLGLILTIKDHKGDTQ